jgi:hypothetical protein
MLALQSGQLFWRIFEAISKHFWHITKCLQGKQIMLQISSKHILQSNISLFFFQMSILIICAEIVFSFVLTIFSRSRIFVEYLHKMDCHLVHIVELWLIQSESLLSLVSTEPMCSFWKFNIRVSHSKSRSRSGLIIFSAEF